jgi:ATP-dependent DNA helicase RecG
MSSNSFIADLLSRKSELNLAFYDRIDFDSILQDTCGMLNSDGGWILVGHNSRESINLKFDQGEIDDIKSNIASSIDPQPLIYVAIESDGENDLILLNILKGSRQPYTYNKKFYKFEKRGSYEASQDDISLLLRSSNEYASTWEKMTSTDRSMNDLVLSEIKSTISDAEKMTKGRSLPHDPEEFLSYFQLSDYGNIRNGALILFGKTPIQFLPQCRIRISVLPEGKTGSIIEDTELIEDNLFASFKRVSQYFRKNNPLISSFVKGSWDRKTDYKFPDDALDEAIVNAMVHRDYGDISGEITINIYPSKIEIINSGEIPSDIIRGKNTIRPHHSIFRNPTISHMFYLRGKMEKLGRGLTLIRDRFVDSGFKKPEWTFQNGYTTLTLFSQTEVIELNDRMKKFLAESNERVLTRQDYEEYFNGSISEKTARNDLSDLVDGGYFNKEGKGSATRYRRTDKELPEDTGGNR